MGDVVKAPTGEGIVLFDGTCAFCEGWVKFIARRDPAGYFRFGASQSPQAARLLAANGLTSETARTLILIEDGRVYRALVGVAAYRCADHRSPGRFCACSYSYPGRCATPSMLWSPASAIVLPVRQTPARSRRRRFGPG